jgi:hypothetical protein
VVRITALITVRKHALVLADIAHRYGATVIMGGPIRRASRNVTSITRTSRRVPGG